MTTTGPAVMPWVTKIGLTILIFSDEKGLMAESLWLGDDTDFDVACFAICFCLSKFRFIVIFVAARSTSIAWPVLCWMNAEIGSMKKLVETSFLQTLPSAS